MSTKKILLLTSVAMAALVIPAGASVEGWTHSGEPLTKTAEIEITGTMGIESELGKFECTWHSTGTLEAGTTGKTDTFSVTTKTCVGTGNLTKCTLLFDSVTGLPYKLHDTGEDLEMTGNIQIHTVLGGECPVQKVAVNDNEVTLTPDNGKSISSVAISGEATADMDGVESKIKTYGSFSVTPSKTYGVE